jgi:hypothetical protein
LQSQIVLEILGENFSGDLDKKDFLVEILVKFDFLLLRGRRSFDLKDKYASSKRQYLIPLLFPKHKPSISISENNDDEILKGSSEIKKINEWKYYYFLPVKTKKKNFLFLNQKKK